MIVTPVTAGQATGGLVTATRVTGGLVWARGPVWDGRVWERFRPDPTCTTVPGSRIGLLAVTGWPDPAEERREPASGREALRADLERDPMQDPG